MGGVRSILRVGKASAPTKQVRKQPTKPSPDITSVVPDLPNEEMLKRLQSIYVESSSTQQTVDNPYSVLPQDRSSGDSVPAGKGYLTVNQVIELLDSYKRKSNTVEELAKSYCVDTAQAKNLLQYFGNFYVVGGSDQSKGENARLKFHPLHR